MKVSEFQFSLPAERIAQQPVSPRDASRLMVLDRRDGSTSHRRFADLPAYLDPGDLLVLNDTRVIPARLAGSREGGGAMEVLLLEPAGAAGGPEPEAGSGEWKALLRGFGRRKTGAVRSFPGPIQVEVIGPADDEPGLDGQVWRVRVSGDEPPGALIRKHGLPPVPPYIRRGPDDPAVAVDRDRYQTVYAERSGAVAAPTAGLHFTGRLLERIRRSGVGVAALTLHVGWGTFQPVRVERVEDHVVAPERFEIGAGLARLHRRTRDRGGKVVAVGTTVARALEHAAGDSGAVEPGSGRCGLVIRPPYEFRALDALVTNFHLPGSSLLFLVAALAGRETILRAYEEAIRTGYRFYSYGDAMLIL